MALYGPPAFLRQALAYAAVSLLLIAPVLVQENVQAGDLASHLYNTWLVLQVKAGAPLGLEVAPQYSNILFDWWLEGLWRLGGPVFAEKAAVSVAVLLFFWGAFFLLGRLTERSAWPSAPLLAMLSYGWIYHQGFFNYYLSCALGFWAVGLAAAGGAAALVAAAALLGAAALGHLIGAALAAACAAFVLAQRKLSPERRKWLLAGGILGVAGIAAALPAALPTIRMTARWLHLSGITPFLAYHPSRYMAPGLLLALYWVTAVLWVAARFRRRAFDHPAAPLMVLMLAGLAMLPTSLVWPGTRQSLFFIDWRLALWFTLFLHAWLCARLPFRFTLGACSAAAVIYFVFLFSDWRTLGQAERAFHETVRRLPHGSRAVTDVTTMPAGMNPMLHMIDRACIGHCFSYGNYEPSTSQFRLRVRAGSPAVLDSPLDVFALQEGRYVVRPRDVPLYGVFLRQTEPFTLEVRELNVGEKIRRAIVPLPAGWF